MAGSYHTLDRLACELAGDTMPPAEEQLAALEAQFGEYEARYAVRNRDLRQMLSKARDELEIYRAANAQLLREVRSYRRLKQMTDQSPEWRTEPTLEEIAKGRASE